MSSTKLVSRVSLLAGLGLLAAGVAGACAANNTSTQYSGTSGGSGGTGQTGSASGGSGGLVLTGSGTGSGAGSGTGGTAACQAETHQAMTLPLDMYIMQDQSGSMSDMVSEGGTKWQAVTSAFTAFVQQPGLTGISVGIQYFDQPASGAVSCTCATSADCTMSGDFCIAGICFECELASGGSSDSCNPADYAKPDVEIAPLPGVATAIMSSLAAHMPSTSTATGPALQGAVDHAKSWAMSHPGDVVIAVLATDGAALAGTPSIKTFTIGTFASGDIPSGPDLLNAVAAAGGTGQAFNIDTTQNVNQSFLMALNQIRGSALGCQYQIPVPSSGSNADPTKINVQYTPGGGSPEIIPEVADMAHCPSTGDGWYYDNPSAPMQILLCGATCSKVQADASGKIEILLGCKTVMAM
jgi:hypothetical protein